MKPLLLVVALLIAPFGMAQDKVLTVAEATAARLSGEISDLQSEEEIIMAELNAMDAKFEKDLNETIDYIVDFRDSYETGTSIIRNKKKLIDDIEASVNFFEEQ